VLSNFYHENLAGKLTDISFNSNRRTFLQLCYKAIRKDYRLPNNPKEPAYSPTTKRYFVLHIPYSQTNVDISLTSLA